MKTILTEQDAPFLPTPNEVQLVLDGMAPQRERTTSALGLFFYNSALLMTRLLERGWDIPGGHIEQNESPEACVRREAYEESGAVLGKIEILGYQKIILHGSKPDGYRYPHPVSYQLFYCGKVEALHPFEPTAEASARALFDPDEARELAWVKRHPQMYEAAYQKVVKRVL